MTIISRYHQVHHVETCHRHSIQIEVGTVTLAQGQGVLDKKFGRGTKVWMLIARLHGREWHHVIINSFWEVPYHFSYLEAYIHKRIMPKVLHLDSNLHVIWVHFIININMRERTPKRHPLARVGGVCDLCV